MMKKLLIGLFAVLCAGGASAQQLDVNGQVNNVTPRIVAKSGVLANVLGLDTKTQQTKEQKTGEWEAPTKEDAPAQNISPY